MPDARARVVLLSLDGFNPTAVSPERTPHLWALRANGGWAPEGGRCDVPAVTYVSHATLATGTFPTTHGLTSNLASAPQPGIVPGWAGEARVRAPTIFDALREAGLRTAAICGDQHLVRIMGAQRADCVWPPGGNVPDEAPRCPAGYALNEAVRGPLLEAVADRDVALVFGHLNETDTWGHLLGPDHPDTLRSYTMADAIIGEVVEGLRPEWKRVVLIVLSDHGMEAAGGEEPVDLLADEAVREVVAAVVADGGAALARVRDDASAEAAGAALAMIPGVDSWRELQPGVLLVSGKRGVLFGVEPVTGIWGMHGGGSTTTTLALVSGGHAAARRIAAAIAGRSPHLPIGRRRSPRCWGCPFRRRKAAISQLEEKEASGFSITRSTGRSGRSGARRAGPQPRGIRPPPRSGAACRRASPSPSPRKAARPSRPANSAGC